MRAVTFASFGGPEVLSISQVPDPQPGAGQVRVRVAAAPVQPGDLAARSGAMGPRMPERRYIPGFDFAGTVDQVGPSATEFAVGDQVVGLCEWLGTAQGAQAEYAVVDAHTLAPAPAGVDLVTASTVPGNALTAAQALDELGIAEDQTLAITGAGGAVGGYAVELARLRGIRVLGVASPQDEAFLTERGAEFLPREEDPVAAVRRVVPGGVDALLDGAGLGPAVLGAVRDGGAFASLIPPATPPAERGITVRTPFLRADGARLRELVALVERGELTPRVAGVLPLERVADAHAEAAKGGVRGRFVLVP